MPDQRSLDNAFDLRARAELALAFDPGQPPAQLFRHTPLLARRGVRSGLVALLQVDDDALAQGALGRPQVLDAELRRQRVEDGQAAAELKQNG